MDETAQNKEHRRAYRSGSLMDQPRMCRITRIVEETRYTKTFFLDCKMDVQPGQFIMLWIPEVDEKPFACSYNGKEFGITVEKKGAFTKELFRMHEDDLVGIRGPYGRSFTRKKNAIAVAGGLGIAPLARLVEELKCDGIIGASRKEDLLYIGRFKKNVLYSTSDGSFGFKGRPTVLLEKRLKEKKYDIVYCCGPEAMMKAVIEICRKYKVECEVSLERYMRCGFGVCGACACSDRLVCKDGPVFSSAELKRMTDFGNFAMLKSGRKVRLEEYFSWREDDNKKR